MKPKKLRAEQQYHLDLELVKKKPANRTEAKAHLAAQLRISKYKTQASSKIRVGSFKGRKKVRKKMLGRQWLKLMQLGFQKVRLNPLIQKEYQKVTNAGAGEPLTNV